jgi:hypothetical protein
VPPDFPAVFVSIRSIKPLRSKSNPHREFHDIFFRFMGRMAASIPSCAIRCRGPSK